MLPLTSNVRRSYFSRAYTDMLLCPPFLMSAAAEIMEIKDKLWLHMAGGEKESFNCPLPAGLFIARSTVYSTWY